MPTIDVAMERSVRRGFSDLLAASLMPLVQRRDALSDASNSISDFKTAFSSWDNCMKANFCKWPVIVLIIIGGLILFSIAWCIIRCACCGLSCCCSCFSCLKCCGDCCGCCDPPRGKRNKYLDEPFIPPDQGYKSYDPMMMPPVRPVTSTHDVPKYAEFEVNRKSEHEDSLPQMPSWEGANGKKMVEEETMELTELRKPEPGLQNVALMTGASVIRGPASPAPGMHSPAGARSPYGPPAGGADPYGQPTLPPYEPVGGAYAQSTTSFGNESAYALGQERRSPMPQGNASAYGYGAPAYPASPRSSPGLNSFGQQPGYDSYGQRPLASQRSFDSYGPNGNSGYRMGTPSNADLRAPMPSAVYPSDMARRSPGPPRSSPAPPSDYRRGNNMQPFGGPTSPQREYSSDSMRPLAARPPPQRQYTSHGSGPSSPSLQNSAGFDFVSGYTRPPTAGSDTRRPSGSSQGAGNGAAYPGQPGGFKAYKPPM